MPKGVPQGAQWLIPPGGNGEEKTLYSVKVSKDFSEGKTIQARGVEYPIGFKPFFGMRGANSDG